MDSLNLLMLAVVGLVLWVFGWSGPSPLRLFRAGSLEGAVLLVIALLSVLAASFISTWFVWETQISETAFHCTEEGCLSIGFWMNPETHQSAGDQLMPGWTWE